MKTMRWYWHIHHDILVEPLIKPLKIRIEYIKKNKSKNEIKLRLKLLKPVKGKLPIEVVKAREAYYKAEKASDKAWKAYDKTREAYDKTREAYDKVFQKNIKAINILHKKECRGCPWNGKSIFTNS